MKNKAQHSPKILLVIRAIVESSDGKILILKRNSDRQYNSNKWELPGGKVLDNEDMETALERLMNKESNLFVKTHSENYYVHSRIVTEQGKYQGYSYFEIALPVHYLAGDVHIAKNDHSEYKWENADKILEYDLSFESRKAISKYISDVHQDKAATESEPTQVIVVSRALIQNNEGKYLLLKRSSTESYPGTWDIPGGKLSSFESLDEHLMREVLEETGLVIEVSMPNLCVHSFIPKEGKYKGHTFINIINRANTKSGKLRLSSEHSEYKWVSENEILDYEMAHSMNLSMTELFGKNVKI